MGFNTAISQMMIFINAAYKEDILEPRYLENGVRLLYSDKFNKFLEINPGEDRMTYTFMYSKANYNDPLPYNYFYDWGDATDGRMLLVVEVEITYNYLGKENHKVFEKK